MKILILGHNGLLGNMVYKYFKSLKEYDIIITDLRWENDNFKLFIKNQNPDFIINCIGVIPQKKPDEHLYNKINYELPLWLDSLGINVIQCDTDEDDSTLYGLSKKLARENVTKNTKMIKTSIIGLEKNNKVSFLEWFLNSNESVSGFTNQYWNGITTLEWAKWCENIIKTWLKYDHVTILRNPNCISKYDIMLSIKKIFDKNIKINPTKLKTEKNTCLEGGFVTKDLFFQLIEMKYFYENSKY